MHGQGREIRKNHSEQLPATAGREEQEESCTRWTQVLKAGNGADDALEWLCRTYWPPLYGVLRNRGYSPDDAKDLVQGFFASFLRREWSKDLSPVRGRFRDFLFRSLTNYATSEWAKGNALKRGGGLPLFSIDTDRWEALNANELVLTDEVNFFDRQWAVQVVNEAFRRLEQQCNTPKKRRLLQELEIGLLGGVSFRSDHKGDASVDDVAERKARSRLRDAFRMILDATLKETLLEGEDLQTEVHHLLHCLTKGIVDKR